MRPANLVSLSIFKSSILSSSESITRAIASISDLPVNIYLTLPCSIAINLSASSSAILAWLFHSRYAFSSCLLGLLRALNSISYISDLRDNSVLSLSMPTRLSLSNCSNCDICIACSLYLDCKFIFSCNTAISSLNFLTSSGLRFFSSAERAAFLACISDSYLAVSASYLSKYLSGILPSQYEDICCCF